MENERNSAQLTIGGVSALDLAEKFGTPLYVYDAEKILKIASAFVSSLKDNYGNGLILYASKAFCCKGIYNLLSELEIGADVVSGGELFTAKKAGFDISKVVFHGNNKSYEELLDAVKYGVKYVVVDSMSEIDILNDICYKFGKKQEILIRVNVGVEAHTHRYIQTAKIDSKFGFSIENGDALSVIKYANIKGNLIVSGLHSHIGSQIFEIKSFIVAVEKIAKFYKTVKDKLGLELRALNLGGGFGIRYVESEPVFTEKSYYDEIKIICDKVKAEFSAKSLVKPFLMFEPGRAIVGEAGYTLYKVGTIKEITGIKTYLSVDGGMFDNPRVALYSAKYEFVYAADTAKAKDKTYSVAGKCCESGDILAENVSLPEVKPGDILAVRSTGAYHYSMASNYNRNLTPAVVFIRNGKPYLAVKRQDYKDLIRNDI